MPSAVLQDAKWFGGGYIFGTQIIAPGTTQPPSILLPAQFATIQEASVDFTMNTKELRGIFEDPEDVASASRKITGKVVTGRVAIELLNKLIFGELGGTNFVTGSRALIIDEPHTIPLTPGPFVDTLTNAATFFEDKGVRYAGTRQQLQPVAVIPPSGLTAGQYSYNPATGVYTFSFADSQSPATAAVLISYSYTTPAVGHTLTVDNLVMGSTVRPVFELLLQNPNDGDQELFLPRCKATKLMLPIKQEDYVKLEIDFIAFADNNGRVAQFLSAY